MKPHYNSCNTNLGGNCNCKELRDGRRAKTMAQPKCWCGNVCAMGNRTCGLHGSKPKHVKPYPRQEEAAKFFKYNRFYGPLNVAGKTWAQWAMEHDVWRSVVAEEFCCKGDATVNRNFVEFKLLCKRLPTSALGVMSREEGALLRACQEAFGMSPEALCAKGRQHPVGRITVACTPQQFADFIILRAKYGAANWVAELDAQYQGEGPKVESRWDVSGWDGEIKDPSNVYDQAARLTRDAVKATIVETAAVKEKVWPGLTESFVCYDSHGRRFTYYLSSAIEKMVAERVEEMTTAMNARVSAARNKALGEVAAVIELKEREYRRHPTNPRAGVLRMFINTIRTMRDKV